MHGPIDDQIIALYCGLVPAPAALAMLQRLIAQNDSPGIAAVLAEAYLTSGPEIHQDRDLRTRVIERLARAPAAGRPSVLARFVAEEVAAIANSTVGTIRTSDLGVNESCHWLRDNPEHLERARLRERIFQRRTETPVQLLELVYLAFLRLDVETLARLADDPALLASRGPCFRDFESKEGRR